MVCVTENAVFSCVYIERVSMWEIRMFSYTYVHMQVSAYRGGFIDETFVNRRSCIMTVIEYVCAYIDDICGREKKLYMCVCVNAMYIAEMPCISQWIYG